MSMFSAFEKSDVGDMPIDEHFEGIGGETIISCNEELFSDWNELKYRNRKLLEENLCLKNQLAISDELCQQQFSEKKSLEGTITSMCAELEKLKELELKNDELKASLLSAEQAKDSLVLREGELVKSNENFKRDIEDLQERLAASRSENDDKQQTLGTLACSFYEQESKIQQLCSENDELKSRLEEYLLKIKELELEIMAVKEANQALRHDNSLKAAELEKAKDKMTYLFKNKNFIRGSGDAPHIGNMSEISLASSSDICASSACKLKSQSYSLGDRLPTSPKLSICDEMNKVMTVAESVPNPLCGKNKACFTERNFSSSLPSSFCNASSKKEQQLKHQRDDNIDSLRKVNTLEKRSIPASMRRNSFRNSSHRKIRRCQTRFSSSGHAVGAQVTDSYTGQLNRDGRDKKDICETKMDITESNLQFQNSSVESNQSSCDSEGRRHRSLTESVEMETKEAMKRNFDELDLGQQLLVGKESERKEAKLPCKDYDTDGFSPLLNFAEGKQSKMFFSQQRSLDGQTLTFLHSHSKKNYVFDGSFRSTPSHEPRFAQSCPILLDRVSVTSKGTQTDTSLEKDSAIYNMSGDHAHNISFHCVMPAHENITQWPHSKDQKFSECASASELHNAGAVNESCSVCDHLSPQIPRHRTNSFLSAVTFGSSNLFETFSNFESGTCEQRDVRFAAFSTSKETTMSSSDNEEVFWMKPPRKSDKSNQQQNIQVISQGTSSTPIANSPPPVSEQTVDSTSNEREKVFKTSQRSLRRGSGANSPNSVTGIPRYKAFDFSEQDEEHSVPSTTTKPVVTFDKNLDSDHHHRPSESLLQQTVPIYTNKESFQANPKKFDTGKATMLIPEVVENSETESAKGSFEGEASELPSTTEVSLIPNVGSAFPNLPNSLLSKLGANKEPSLTQNLYDEQELENKFLSLALAFNTDKLTLPKRLEIQKHLRDIAERDMENEIKAIKNSLNYLGYHTNSAETRDLITGLQNHVDIINSASANVSARSEAYGAVQQEERVSGAFQIMLLHVENLKRMFDREHRELEETKQMLTGPRIVDKETSYGEAVVHEQHKRSLKSVGMAVGTIKSVFNFSALFSVMQRLKKVVRRASVAEFRQLSSCQNSIWTPASKGKESRLFKAFAPLTSSSSANSSSSSSSIPAYMSPSWSSYQGSESRRCSLNITPSRDSFLSTPSSISKVLKSPIFNRPTKDSKVSCISPLSPVVDEEPSEIEASNEELNGSLKELRSSPQASYVNDNFQNDFRQNEDFDDIKVSYDAIHDVVERSIESCPCAEETKVTFLERLGCTSLYQILRTTSPKNLFRYAASIFLGLMAILVFMLSVIPSNGAKSQNSCNIAGWFDFMFNFESGKRTV